MVQSIDTHVPFVRRRYRAALIDFRESFSDIAFDAKSPLHQYVMDESRRHMAAQLPGAQYVKLREKLQPHYAVGCKRVFITDDYFRVFTQDNITLETSQIKEITPNWAAVEGDNSDEFDLLVLATGYNTTQFMYPIELYGSDGTSIQDIWSCGAFA